MTDLLLLVACLPVGKACMTLLALNGHGQEQFGMAVDKSLRYSGCERFGYGICDLILLQTSVL